MSRVLDAITLPDGVKITQSGQEITATGKLGSLTITMNSSVKMDQSESEVKFAPLQTGNRAALAMVGTTKALVNNLITGVSTGFERKLELVGVGYRAQVKGTVLNLTLGFSHPVDFPIPDAVTIETPTPTEVVIKGNDKQQIGQIAANIRAYRPPEPYKGKGVRYTGERIIRKEAKKK
ncbi:MAG: 50S ribosomal protein L6 [Gammaproteobacteria bacterium]|nr:50S ribosomal protein L6 [Gammaproteobacteria bacterium]